MNSPVAALKRTRMLVALAEAPDTTHEVEALNPDFIVVESAAPRQGMILDPKVAPMSYMTALAWAAMTRTGAYAGSLSEFKARDCRQLEVVKEADEADEADDVPPTRQGRGTDSPSSSQATTAAAPDSGLTSPTTA